MIDDLDDKFDVLVLDFFDEEFVVVIEEGGIVGCMVLVSCGDEIVYFKVFGNVDEV